MPGTPLSREQFQQAFQTLAPRVAQSAPPGLSREQFNDLVIQEIERTQDQGHVSLMDRAIPSAMRIVPTVAGGFIGSALGPLGTVAGGGLGASLGEYAAELYEGDTGQRQGVNPKQVAVQGALGAIPLGRVAGSTIGQIAARRALQGAGLGAVSSALTESTETGELPSLGTVARGAALGGLLGGVAGHVEGRGLRRLGRLETPPREPAGYLSSGLRYVVTPDGRTVPVGADVPESADRSFVRSEPGEYARREIAGLLPAGRDVITPEPTPGSVPEPRVSGGRSVPAASYFDENGANAVLRDRHTFLGRARWRVADATGSGLLVAEADAAFRHLGLDLHHLGKLLDGFKRA